MISFTVITSTPLVLRNQLLNRGIVEQKVGVDGQNILVGVKKGLEWLEVPNPIVTTLGSGEPMTEGYVPPVMDTRRVFLVKFAHENEGDQTKDIQQDDDVVEKDPEGKDVTVKRRRSVLGRTKWGQWIMANSTAATITSADGRSWPARKVGTATWFVQSDDFGVWQ